MELGDGGRSWTGIGADPGALGRGRRAGEPVGEGPRRGAARREAAPGSSLEGGRAGEQGAARRDAASGSSLEGGRAGEQGAARRGAAPGRASAGRRASGGAGSAARRPGRQGVGNGGGALGREGKGVATARSRLEKINMGPTTLTQISTP